MEILTFDLDAKGKSLENKFMSIEILIGQVGRQVGVVFMNDNPYPFVWGGFLPWGQRMIKTNLALMLYQT